MSSVLPTPTSDTVGTTMTIPFPAPDDPGHELELQKLQLAQMDKPSLEIKCLDLFKQNSKLEESKARIILEKLQLEKELTEKDATERQLNKQIGLLELQIANKVGQGKGGENPGPFGSNSGGLGTSRMLFAPGAAAAGTGLSGSTCGGLGTSRMLFAPGAGTSGSIGGFNFGSLPPGTVIAYYDDSAGSIRGIPLGVPGLSLAGAGPTGMDMDKGSGSLSEPANSGANAKAAADGKGKPKAKAKPKGPTPKPVAQPKKQPKAKAKPKPMWGWFPTEPKRFRCLDCPKQYATKNAYFNHVAMHMEKKDNK